MFFVFLFFAMIGGVAATVQTVLNSQLRTWVGHPIYASFVSFFGGALVLFIFILIFRWPLPQVNKLVQTPWWLWCGGALGAFYIWSTIIVLPKLGTALVMGMVVTGQMAISLFLDHFGYFGLDKQPITPSRIIGILFLLLGVFFLLRGK